MKMAKNKNTGKKGLSPVVAAIVLIAVTVAAVIAVAAWLASNHDGNNKIPGSGVITIPSSGTIANTSETKPKTNVVKLGISESVVINGTKIYFRGKTGASHYYVRVGVITEDGILNTIIESHWTGKLGNATVEVSTGPHDTIYINSQRLKLGESTVINGTEMIGRGWFDIGLFPKNHVYLGYVTPDGIVELDELPPSVRNPRKIGNASIQWGIDYSTDKLRITWKDDG